MKWKDKLVKDIQEAVKNDAFWSELFKKEINNGSGNIHLAIFNELFLEMMYNNKKTVESRFSINNVAPYNRITTGDIVLVKRSGGSIEAAFIAKDIHFFRNLNAARLKELEVTYGKTIGWDIDPDYLSNKSSSRYLTLIGISNFTKIPTVPSGKKDKTGWSLVKLGYKNTLFEI